MVRYDSVSCIKRGIIDAAHAEPVQDSVIVRPVVYSTFRERPGSDTPKKVADVWYYATLPPGTLSNSIPTWYSRRRSTTAFGDHTQRYLSCPRVFRHVSSSTRQCGVGRSGVRLGKFVYLSFRYKRPQQSQIFVEWH
jgi:hypothetical protein